jgi:signal transduction histidine kinase
MLDRRHLTAAVPFVAAILVIAIGGVSLAGWLLHEPMLLALADWPPIPANAALALITCGAGAIGLRAPRVIAVLVTLLGIAVAAACCATLAESVLHLDFAIDQVLAADWLARFVAHPGRMPENTAIALGLAGAALATARRAPTTAGLFGGLCAAIGATALLGYVTAIEPAHRWAASPSMAPATAIGLLLLGFVWWPARKAPATDDPLTTWRGPLVVGVAAASVTLLFWQALHARDERLFRRVVEGGAQRVETELRAGVNDRAFALAILAREWADRAPATREGWISDARLALAQVPGLIAVEWIEANGTVRWIHPTKAELPAPDVARLPRFTSRVVFTRPFALGARTVGFRVLAPVRKPGFERSGWISGTFETQSLFADVLGALDDSFQVAISAEGVPLFRSSGESPARPASIAEAARMRFAGALALDLRVAPSQRLVASMRSQLPPVLLVGGLSLSALAALALGLLGVASARARAHASAVDEILRLNLELEARVQQRTRELARSNEGLRQFASFLSHELRQPLSTQAVWADLLETKHGEALDEDGRHCVSRLRSGATRMGELLDAQLALAFGKHGALRAGPFDLGELADEITSSLRSELAAARARVLRVRLPAVHADRAQLGQLIRNLLENAIKYRSDERPLRIRLSGRVEAGNVLFCVEDNGRGFPQAQADRIFEASVRLEPGSGSGDGIGLALCRHIAATHGGWIRARSAPGKGAAFTVVLPAVEPR